MPNMDAGTRIIRPQMNILWVNNGERNFFRGHGRANICISAAHRHLRRQRAAACPNWPARRMRTAANEKRRKLSAHNDLREMNKNEYYSFRTTPYSSVPISPSRWPRCTKPARERGTEDDFEAPHTQGSRTKRICGRPSRAVAPARRSWKLYGKAQTR